jgi:hypothetical protein
VAAGQVTQPLRAAGGAAAIPLTRVVYAATSLTSRGQRCPAGHGSRPQPGLGVLAERDRSMPSRSGSTPATPHRPLATLRTRLGSNGHHARTPEPCGAGTLTSSPLGVRRSQGRSGWELGGGECTRGWSSPPSRNRPQAQLASAIGGCVRTLRESGITRGHKRTS